MHRTNLLNRIYTLAVSAVLLGVLRAIATLVLDRHWANGLERLAIDAFQNALIGPDVIVRSVVAAGASLLVAAIASRLISPWFRSPEGRQAATSAAMVLVFWAIAAAGEVTDRTTLRNIMTTNLHFGVAQISIVTVALVGAGISFASGRGLGGRKGARASVATGAILLAWVIAGQGIRVAAVLRDAPPSPSRPNVLLISIDTLRADHLSSYGYPRKTSPRIDELASRGIVFDNAIAQAPNTHPSMAALLTSRYPSELGNNPYKYIPYDTATVTEAFLNAGYATAAIVSNVWLKASMGFDQGFEYFDERSAISEFYEDGQRVAWKTAADVTNAALGWLETERDAPFFLWVHYLDPHHPYAPPVGYQNLFSTDTQEHGAFLEKLSAMATSEQTRTLSKIGTGEIQISDGAFQAIIDQYDGEIAFTDAEVGRLLDRLSALGLATNTMIVVTADHGEEFRDHGAWGHSHALHRELVQIPLVIVLPGPTEPHRVPTTVRSIDVAPTMLTFAGIDVPSSMRGADLLERVTPRPAISMLMRRTEQVSIAWDGWKLIIDFDRTRPQLFDLASDPQEHRDLARAKPEQVVSLLAILDQELNVTARVERIDTTAGQLDASTRKQLEALGYID